MKNKPEHKTGISTLRIFGYALGEGASSITMNGMGNFAMLFYTQILGISAAYAGIAMSITLFWDAVTDPVMGHISDNTRSRFGRRHPYILFGGTALAFCFFMLWTVPVRFSSPAAIFCCILLINLLVRTALTVYVVPYSALGFEVCQDYEDRSRLQGARFSVNQMVNLLFGAVAWSLFFKDEIASDGSRIDGSLIQSNYLVMGATLALAALVLVFFCVLATRRYAVDTRNLSMEGNNLRAFFRNIRSIFQDRPVWYIFGFFSFAQLAMLMTAQVQMFTYVHYMRFTATEKTFVHGAGMLAFALGSLNLVRLVRRFDKKPAGYIGMSLSMLGGLSLLALFTGGIVEPRQVLTINGVSIPLATILFGLCQMMWWGGCGIVVPLAVSMVADLSAINQQRTGLLKNGSYAAVFSFLLKASSSIGLLITGWLVTGAGIVAGAETQTAEAARNVAVMTFLSGPLIIAVSFLILRKYPVTRIYMEQLHIHQKDAE
ncbi:MAG: MFS transporter [Kiritimatiellales bacterium]